MKMEITDKRKNALMKRDEVLVSIDHAGKPTPNRKEITNEAAKALKTKPENLIVTKITTPGGSTISTVKVYSYSKKDDIPEWKVKKFTERVAKIKGTKPPEPKLEEKPAEEAPAAEEKPAEAAQEGASEAAPEAPSEDKPSSEDTQKGTSKKEEPAAEPKEETSDDKSAEDKPKEEADSEKKEEEKKSSEEAKE